MDDLLLFTLSKKSHMDKSEDLLKALLKNGLKISPKKCQLFRTNLQYMGNEIFTQNKRVCQQTLRSRLEAIQKLQPPLHGERIQKLCRDGKLFEYVLPRATETIKTNIWLDQERKTIYLGKEQEDSFDEIKCRLVKPPDLHMPNKRGRFHLYLLQVGPPLVIICFYVC